MLSILQAPGAGNVTLKKENMNRFRFLVGLELQGVTPHEGDVASSVLRISADALSNHQKTLTYLNLEKVLIEQRNVEPDEMKEEEVYVRVRKVGEEENDLLDNSVHLLYVGEKKEDVIVPYSEYKKSKNDSNDIPPPPPFPKKNITPKIAVAFTHLSKLVHLRISSCHMLDISWDMFHKMGALKYLLLENNDLLFLPDFVFYSTPNLTALSLAGNRILNLQTVGLAGLLHLEKLDVTHNNITHLSELSLPPFPHLELADFRYNPIESIFPNTFEVMNSTKELYLGNPNVPLEFLANSFYGLTSLEKLDIRNAKVGALERPMLKGMPELRILKLTDGSVPRILYDAFAEIPKLEKLSLKNCGLKKISMDAFYGLDQLQTLDLSYNKLVFLPPGLFDEQRNLQDLYLGHNNLETVPAGIFDQLPAKMIRLDGNPWHCNCDMITWDPTVINVVKKYSVVRNMTNCHRAYDKGSMCSEEFTLQVKYVHEKRVSPICNSPTKFMKKSIFQVLRKGLDQCEAPIKKAVAKISKMKKTILQTESDNSTTATTMKPVKVKKPTKTPKATPAGTLSSTTTTAEPINSISLLAAMDPLLEREEPYYRQVAEARLHPLTEAGARLKMKMQSLPSFSHRIHLPPKRVHPYGFNQTTGPSNFSKKSLKLAQMLKARG